MNIRNKSLIILSFLIFAGINSAYSQDQKVNILVEGGNYTTANAYQYIEFRFLSMNGHTCPIFIELDGVSHKQNSLSYLVPPGFVWGKWKRFPVFIGGIQTISPKVRIEGNCAPLGEIKYY